MSSEVAVKVAKRLRIFRKQGVPSAFQVRLGGAKGMLTVWDEAFPNHLKGEVDVILRNSMKKFDCGHTDIEVVGYSKRVPLYLNRQVISLLSGHGVPDKAFLRLQESALDLLNRAMRPNGKQAALRLLQSGTQDGGHKVGASGSGVSLSDYFHAGLTCANCEHLFNMMCAVRRQSIKEMMTRARIPVDVKNGFVALGVLDELGVLGPREIFCQYTDPHSGDVQVVEGLVTLGRNPGLHPGDIQPVTAVNHKELGHLKDVIVFPQRGYRPITSMLSGGDLDGDLYFVLFDDSLKLPIVSEIPPMEYIAPSPKTLNRNVTWEDVADFFVEFTANDRLGVIANAHVVQADKQEEGIFSDECKALASLHSIAVDFPKTGIQADLKGTNLLPRQLPNSYPDFMGKHKKISYQSTRVLGKLYRACLAQNNKYGGNCKQQFQENEGSRKVDRILNEFAKSDEMIQNGRHVCKAYNGELHILMVRYGVETEGEIVSGQIVRFAGRFQTRGKNDYFAQRQQVNRQMKELRDRVREEFLMDIDGNLNVMSVMKAACWYKACQLEAEAQRGAKQNPVLVSFPWAVSDVLLGIVEHELGKQ